MKVTEKVQSVSECLSVWYFLNHRTFCYQIGHEPECRVEIFVVVVAIFKVKVTVGVHIIKIWLFLLYFLNCWFLVWWYMIISQSVLWKKVRLLHSGSRSQRRVKILMFVQMISSKPPSILFPNLVLWCIIVQELTMIKIWQCLVYLLNCWSFCYQTWFDSTLS